MALTTLPGSFRGELIRPGDPSYDEHRKVWNGSIERSPAVIARCAGAREVVDAVALARESGLPTAVRGGGHSFPMKLLVASAVVLAAGVAVYLVLDPFGDDSRAHLPAARPGRSR